MAEMESSRDRSVGIRQDRRDRIAKEMRVDDLPVAVAARELEETLAGPAMEAILPSSAPLTT